MNDIIIENVLLVDMKKNRKFKSITKCGQLEYDIPGTGGIYWQPLPAGEWEYVGTTDEMEAPDFQFVIKYQSIPFDEIYYDYVKGTFTEPIPEYSFRSMLLSVGADTLKRYAVFFNNPINP
jgi:hypothetical protein